jgi:hypothetical protein
VKPGSELYSLARQVLDEGAGGTDE